MAVPPKEAGQADFSFPSIIVGIQIQLLSFEILLQPVFQDVVLAPLPA